MMKPDPHPDTLVTITCDQEGLKTMIHRKKTLCIAHFVII